MSHTLTHTKVCGSLSLQQACVAAPDSTAKTSKLRCREDGATMVQEPPERCDPGSVAASAVHIKFMQQCQSVTGFESFRSLGKPAPEQMWQDQSSGHQGSRTPERKSTTRQAQSSRAEARMGLTADNCPPWSLRFSGLDKASESCAGSTLTCPHQQ